MLVKSDPQLEENMLQKLLESDPKLKRQSEQFWAEMEIKKKRIELRRSERK